MFRNQNSRGTVHSPPITVRSQAAGGRLTSPDPKWSIILNPTDAEKMACSIDEKQWCSSMKGHGFNFFVFVVPAWSKRETTAILFSSSFCTWYRCLKLCFRRWSIIDHRLRAWVAPEVHWARAYIPSIWNLDHCIGPTFFVVEACNPTHHSIAFQK